MTLPPSSAPLVAPVDEPAGAPMEARREELLEPEPALGPQADRRPDDVPADGQLPTARPVAVDGAGLPEPVDAGAHGGSLVPFSTPTFPTPTDGAAPVAPVDRAGEPVRGGGPPRPDGPTERPPAERSGSCTTAQLRRFIKSRAYVPMHEIRRRFLIVSEDDDVTGINVDGGSRIFVGLPEREGLMLGELFRSGEIGYELQLDPRTPVVVGVYPMRPVSRT